jgi:hypothetical protein
MEVYGGLPGKVVVGSSVEELELLDCLRKIGKGLVAAGTAVGVVENTLTEIAMAYEMVMLILSITLGVLLGTLLISPYKFVPVSEIPGKHAGENSAHERKGRFR